MTLFAWFECKACGEDRPDPAPPCPKCGATESPREHIGDVRRPVAPPTKKGDQS